MNDLRTIVDNAISTLTLTDMTFAQLITRIGINIVNVKKNVLAWTDGKGIYINEFEFNSLNEKKTLKTEDGREVSCTIDKDNIIFVMCHELMHLLTNTIERGTAKGVMAKACSQRQIYLHKLWNIATDYEINYMLHNNSYDGRSMPLGKKLDTCLYSEKYGKLTAEEIFDELEKELKSKPQAMPAIPNKQGNSGMNGDGDGQDNDSNGKNNSGESGSGDVSNTDSDKMIDHLLDEHPEIDEMTKNEIKGMINDILASGQSFASSALNRGLEIVLKPEPFNWRKALTKYFRQFVKSNYTWNKPSRAGVATGLRLPSTGTTPSLRVGVAIDTSGSVTDDLLQTLMNHVYTILTQFKHFEVEVFCVSTEVHENTLVKFTPSNKNKIKDYKFDSNGGTVLKTIFPFVETKFANNPLDVLLVLTDGEDYEVDNSETLTCVCPVVWMIVNNNDFHKPVNMRGEVYEFKAN